MQSDCCFYISYNGYNLLFEQNPGYMCKSYISGLIHSYFGVSDAFITCNITRKASFSSDISILESITKQMAMNTELDIEEFAYKCSGRRSGMIVVTPKPACEHMSNDEKNVMISNEKWEELMGSIKMLQTYIKNVDSTIAVEDKYKRNDITHHNIKCNNCTKSKKKQCEYIRGTRYNCLSCIDFNLCSKCENAGCELLNHKPSHNMIKINTPLPDSTLWNKPSSVKQTKHNKEVIIGIPEENTKVYEFFSQMNSLSLLEEVISGYKKYKNLVNRNQRQNVSNNTINLINVKKNNTKIESNSECIKVTTHKMDFAYTFKLENIGETRIPAGLHFRFSLGNFTTGDIAMGQYELRTGESKVLHFNTFNFIEDTTLQQGPQDQYIILANSEGRNVLFGSSFEGETVYLYPPHLTQENLQSMEKSLSSLYLQRNRNSSISYSNDEDIISTTVTDVKTNVHSNLADWEDYDLLSDSDV